MIGINTATPHVAGVAALYLETNPDWKPAQVWDAIRDHAVSDVLRNTGTGSPNRLVLTQTLNQMTQSPTASPVISTLPPTLPLSRQPATPVPTNPLTRSPTPAPTPAPTHRPTRRPTKAPKPGNGNMKYR